MNVLVLEDDDRDFKTLRSALRQYLEKYPDKEIQLIHCKNKEEFKTRIQNNPEGVVCDIKLFGGNGQEENGREILKEFVEKLHKDLYLIPLAILTKLSDDEGDPWIPVFVKEKNEYPKLFEHLWSTYQTGISEITGLNGSLLKKLKEIFSHSIEKHFNTWKRKIQEGKTPQTVRKSLQRYILSHLLYELSEADKSFQPEEFFLYTANKVFQTGRIVEDRQKKQKYMIINPPCDLASKNPPCIYLLRLNTSFLNVLKKKEGVESDKLKRIRSNNYAFYYHYIPEMEYIEESLLDFRIIRGVKKCQVGAEDSNKEYLLLPWQISPEFVKNIQSRFASYYARQGQPDLEV